MSLNISPMADLVSPAVSLSPSSCPSSPSPGPLTPVPLNAAFLSCFSGYNATPSLPFLYYSSSFSIGKLPLPPETPGKPLIYVNAKQCYRILRRRAAKQAQGLHIKRSPGYLHESRHRHACSRPRGPSGTFLSKS